MTIFSKQAIFPQITAAGSAPFCSEAAIAMQSSPSVCRVRRPCSDRWMETKGKHKRCSFGPDLCRAMIYGYSQSCSGLYPNQTKETLSSSRSPWREDMILLMSEIRLTSWYGKYSVIYRVLYIPGGAGFQPSTVWHDLKKTPPRPALGTFPPCCCCYSLLNVPTADLGRWLQQGHLGGATPSI